MMPSSADSALAPAVALTEPKSRFLPAQPPAMMRLEATANTDAVPARRQLCTKPFATSHILSAIEAARPYRATESARKQNRRSRFAQPNQNDHAGSSAGRTVAIFTAVCSNTFDATPECRARRIGSIQSG
jgi:hypothetical protein